MNRKATVVWEGEVTKGTGQITTESKALDHSKYSMGTRFESQSGTNPEELIAAAHAACFSMALSFYLGEAGFKSERISTTGTVTLQKQSKGWSITEVRLETLAHVPKIDQPTFERIANEAKENCPVSRLLQVPVHLTADLEAQASDLQEAI